MTEQCISSLWNIVNVEVCFVSRVTLTTFYTWKKRDVNRIHSSGSGNSDSSSSGSRSMRSGGSGSRNGTPRHTKYQVWRCRRAITFVEKLKTPIPAKFMDNYTSGKLKFHEMSTKSVEEVAFTRKFTIKVYRHDSIKGL